MKDHRPVSGQHHPYRLSLLRKRSWLVLCLLCLVGGVSSCENDGEELSAGETTFTLLRQADTGLSFRNSLTQDASFNVFNYMYFYNGGGLAAGDFNQDGRIDLYFTSNMEDNQLFLNQGGLRFQQVGPEAGVSGQPGWATGASVVDINQDGLLDIYVSQVGDYLTLKGANQLYVCQEIRDGIPIFKDEAAAYGLDLVGFGTQATFFDYDGDGDLDMYQLNHSLHQNGTFGPRKGLTDEPHPLAGDRLLRNDGGRFTDVSQEAGIYGAVIGYGLGVATGDVNNDGWPDLYVGNDFHENDYLYLNQRDGTFREVLTEVIDHTSRFSMGVDITDINNDGNADLFSLDMLPEDPQILKASLGEDGFDVFKFKLGFGYNPQFSRNTLQLNDGSGQFREIGAFAGVHATDWSWAPLFFDINADGYRDLFISNGIPRRMNDIDYINFKTIEDPDVRKAKGNTIESELDFIEEMPEIKLRNKVFLNDGQLRFTDLSDAVRGATVSYSSSAVYADLDNDGDLDVVTNNIDDEPFVYRNDAEREGHTLRLNLRGPDDNRNAVGATAIAYVGEQRLVYEHFPTRGYQASSLGPLHLGLGGRPDSIVLVWPDRTVQDVPVDQLDTLLTVTWRAGLPAFDFGLRTAGPEAELALRDVSGAAGVDFVHTENAFVDFSREPLIPFMASTEGPGLAVGDVNGDGRDDFFVGSSKRNRSVLYVQNTDGTFSDRTAADMIRDSVFEDVDAIFVDLDQDGDLDLAVAAGGNEYFAKQQARLQRTYLNDGQGNFTREDLFPPLYMTASSIVAGDFTGDGLPDIFLAGRIVPRAYGLVPESYLLVNESNGRFREATDELAYGLKTTGMIKDAVAADLDKDGDIDLIVAAEWQPLTVWRNEGGQLRPEPLTDRSGWWNHLSVADADGDGDLDILAGNFGANNKLKPTLKQPLTMYVADFDNNEKIDQILTYFVKGREIPFASHAELIKQLPSLKKRYLFAQDLAQDDLATIFGEAQLAAAEKFEVNTLESLYLENRGGEGFVTHLLPDGAQLSTIHAAGLLAGKDDSSTWLIGGNFLGSNIEMGWYDASEVQGLRITRGGQMATVPLRGARIDGEVRGIVRLRDGRMVVARSGGRLVILDEP